MKHFFVTLKILSFLFFAIPNIQSQAVYPLLDFEGPDVPLNGDNNTYPSQYGGAGTSSIAIDLTDAASGSHSLALTLESGKAYPQFNPYNYDGFKTVANSPRGFAREYAENPTGWEYNTFDRFSFWIKCPLTATALRTTGNQNMEFGTYVKRVNNPDNTSDEEGGDHYYHFLNIAPTDTWTKVILNMHPNHRRTANGNTETGNLIHPTGENDYNYFDALTRFYIEFSGAPSAYPATYKLDGFKFYEEQYAENDTMIYSIAATYVQPENRIILSWSRHKEADLINHEVRYAFQDIHQIGWNAATAAPSGIITPPGSGGYNGMVYNNTTLPLSGNSVVYLAIKPQNSDKFSQISIPVGLITDVKDEHNSRMLDVYPNPVTGSDINISLEASGQTEVFVKLINANGQLVRSGTYTAGQERKINVEDLPSGMYHLQVISEEGIETRQIVVE